MAIEGLDSDMLRGTTLNESRESEASSVSAFAAGLSLTDFRLVRSIGYGSVAVVHLAQDRRSGHAVAIKEVKKSHLATPASVVGLFREKAILAKIGHPLVVGLLDTFHNSESLFFVLEFVPGGDLYALMRQNGRFSCSQTRFFAAELVSVLLALHSKCIVYRDLKAENVLIASNGHIKLADFGCAKELKKEEKTMSLCGTPHCIAPEVLLQSGHNWSCDWWSLGVLLYEMIAGQQPFEGDSPYELYVNVLSQDVRRPKQADNDAAELLAGLLCKDQVRRLQGELVKSHKFFRGVQWDNLAQVTPLYVPKVQHSLDCSNFEYFDPPLTNIQSSHLQDSVFFGF